MSGVLRGVVGAGALRVELIERSTVRWAAEASWATPQELGDRVAELTAHPALPARGGAIRFELQPGLFQQRVLERLPMVRRRELLALLRHAPARYFRRQQGPLVVDAGWVGTGDGSQAFAVAVAEALLSALTRGAREAGLRVVDIAPQTSEPRLRLSLLPPEEHAARLARRRRWTFRLTWAAGAAWAGLVAVVLIGRLVERRRVAAQLEELRAPLAALAVAAAATDTVERMVERIAREGAEEGAVLATLFRVVAALPDSTLLTQVQVDGSGVGIVSGAAGRPTAVLAAIESRARVEVPRFRGRTSREVLEGRPVERFTIGFGAEAHP